MSQTYTDPRDGSTMRVEPMRKSTFLKEDLLRFVGSEDSDYTTVDLNRESVKALVEQATVWLENTKSKLPTRAGSVVRANNPDPAVVLLHHDGEWYGASGQSLDPDLWADGWVLVHDAGA